MHPRLVLLLFLFLTLGSTAWGQFRRVRQLADKQYELRAYRQAIDTYRRALDLRPDDRGSLAAIADAYVRLNRLDSAAYYYQRALEDRRVDAATVFDYGQLLRALGRYALAEQMLRTAAAAAEGTRLAPLARHYAESAAFATRQGNSDAGFAANRTAFSAPGVPDYGPTLTGPGSLIFNTEGRLRVMDAASGELSNLPGALVLFRGGRVGMVAFSPDGREVVFTRHLFTPDVRPVPGSGESLTLFIADVDPAGEWTDVRALPFNDERYNSGYANWGRDGNTLYFASDRPGGRGGYDIYVAQRTGDVWEGIPRNLGAVVNSPGNEITPFSDGRNLYFSSDFHHGMGMFDIFRTGLSQQQATGLFHLGGAVNSPRDDYGFVYDAGRGYGYLVSNRGADGAGEDIFRLTRTVVDHFVTVVDAEGLPLAGVNLDMTDCGLGTVHTDSSGYHHLEMTRGRTCTMRVSLAGFPTTEQELNREGNSPQAHRIVMEREGEPTADVVRGYVSRMEDGLPLAEATVKLYPRGGGDAATATTDAEGAYTLALSPSTAYDLSISAPGYTTVTFPLQSRERGSNDDLLGNTGLLPGEGTVGTGNFAVQLASLGTLPEQEAFAAAASLGKVYTIREGEQYRVRVGPFATERDALRASRRAVDLGFGGSFVVDVANRMEGVVAPAATPSPAIEHSPPTASATYRVQLGAFSRPENFDRARAARLGRLITEPRGELTVFLIDDIADRATAEQVRDRAQQMGYQGAYMLKREAGTARYQKVR